MKITNSFFILLLLFTLVIPAAAEAGNVTISDDISFNNYNFTQSGTPAGAGLWTRLLFDNANYNYAGNFRFCNAGITYGSQFRLTNFTVSSGGTGTGFTWYDKNTTCIYYVFSADSLITSSTIDLTFGTNIFSDVTYTPLRTADSPSSTKPLMIAQTGSGGNGLMGTYYDINVATRATDTYNVIYPMPGFFNVSIIKNPYVSTKYFIEGQNSIYSQETSFNKVNIAGAFFKYNDGIYLNATLASGIYTVVIVNTTGTTTASTAPTITTDKASYQRADPITITVTNPSASKVYVTGYGPTGIMTDILWNGEVAAGTSKTWNKIIKDDYPLGQYSISAATTDSYAPVVAITYFNITLPANTTNKLGLLWDQAVYLLGQTGTINSQSNFNATTLLITSPGGHTQTFNFAANATNSTGISLDESGTWQAKLTDNGNASNYLISTTESINNQTNEQCSSVSGQKTYICWDKLEYRQGEIFKINFKITPGILDILNPYPSITILNPDGQNIYNRSINNTYNPQTATYQGTVTGSFSNTATIGVYKAQLIYYGDPIKEAWSELLRGNGTTIPTPTPGAGGMSTQATNLLNVFTYMAFYGLVIFLGIFFSAIKLMTAHGAQANGHALVIIMAVVATMEALIGLFDPFKFYIIVITWIFAAIYFRQNRTAATGEQ